MAKAQDQSKVQRKKKKKNISTYTHICVEKNKQRKVNIYMVM